MKDLPPPLQVDCFWGRWDSSRGEDGLQAYLSHKDQETFPQETAQLQHPQHTQFIHILDEVGKIGLESLLGEEGEEGRLIHVHSSSLVVD